MTAPALHSERAELYVPAAQHDADSMKAALRRYREQAEREAVIRRQRNLRHGFNRRRLTEPERRQIDSNMARLVRGES